MADETNVDKLFDPTDSINLLQNNLDKLLETARVQAAYGEPIRNGDTVIIPTAEVLGLMGLGIGAGGSRDDKQQIGGGVGGGGGGRTLSRPVAAIVLTPNRVRVEPIVDVTKVWMAGLTAAGFMFAMLARMSRRRAPRE
ncbi:MAG: spore germination protein GerW family protein [Acidobacteriota bacterium]